MEYIYYKFYVIFTFFNVINKYTFLILLFKGYLINSKKINYYELLFNYFKDSKRFY